MSDSDKDDGLDRRVSLLGIYATQFGSYSSLLWQVPALGLTAQSFLLTIALSHGNSKGADIIAPALAMLIALASLSLMHGQRGFAITHAWFVRQLAMQLPSACRPDGVEDLDAEPQLQVVRGCMEQPRPVRLRTRAARNTKDFLDNKLKLPVGSATTVKIDAVSVWQVPHLIYHVWRWCMIAFVVADIVIIISAAGGLSWF
jgi:hypothetical protein